jgi:hypothetical protein
MERILSNLPIRVLGCMDDTSLYERNKNSSMEEMKHEIKRESSDYYRGR